MSNLTTEEKIYLVECFFSEKVYSNKKRGLIRGFHFMQDGAIEIIKVINVIEKLIPTFQYYSVTIFITFIDVTNIIVLFAHHHH
ncbi:hypothetical protein X777_14233 [Ooceraea biroi]|uniref:Uncharacterized protein n=1 Tax=Ooceraea biroi TaxID=2015173 RepID=A0A026VWU0_OOCBI|nr:hypothetical protein X777_14233 [Ooceraea biroi]